MGNVCQGKDLINSKKETLACLIIDDPLLRPNYGFVNYNMLFQEMKEHSFFTEVAFIPWNYKRSSPKTIRLFKENPEYFAICVHGCNHTANEFGSVDYNELLALASTALWRMEQHKIKTGLSYDPIIVFPRSEFSKVAIKALKDTGYLAACNSGLIASDTDILIDDREYLKACSMLYHDFPLFFRRAASKNNKEKILNDIKMGRPVILAEHHDGFKNGYKELTELVDYINSFGNIRWTSLQNIAEHYLGEKECKIKKMEDLSDFWKRKKLNIALRRFVSEIRDNIVDTNRFWSTLHGVIKSKI